MSTGGTKSRTPNFGFFTGGPVAGAASSWSALLGASWWSALLVASSKCALLVASSSSALLVASSGSALLVVSSGSALSVASSWSAPFLPLPFLFGPALAFPLPLP